MGPLWGTSPWPTVRPSSFIQELVFLLYSSGATRSHNGFCVIWRPPQPQLSLALEPCSLLRCDLLWTIVWLSSRLGVPHTLFPSEQPLQPHQLSQNHLTYLYPMWGDLRPHYSSSLIMLGGSLCQDILIEGITVLPRHGEAYSLPTGTVDSPSKTQISQ